MISRREFLGTSLGAGATLALTPELLLRAFQPSAGTLIQRAVPSSGEMLPVIGLGRGNHPADDAALKEVLRTLVEKGGKVLDTVHGGPSAEEGMGTLASELGIQNQIFWSAPVYLSRRAAPGTAAPPPKTDPDAVRAAMEERFARLKVPRIDLVMVLAVGTADIPTELAVLREMKKEGRVRYIGVTDLLLPPSAKVPGPVAPNLLSLMRNEPIDFVGFDYSLGDRRAEEMLLPLAQERKIGVLAYFSFDRGRLFQRAGTTPLPEWAAEFDATTWAQFFLKYVISHPAVTVARAGTTNPTHMLENIGGGVGRLPTEATRKRMAELVDSWPQAGGRGTPPAPQPPQQAPAVVLSAAILDRYAGEYKTPAGNLVTFRRDGERLVVKQGSNPELPLAALSETRFADPRGPILEFQLDPQGNVTGAIVEQGNPVQRVPLTRIR